MGSEKEKVSESFVMKEGADSVADTDINFSSFVMSLATQAMMQMGELPPPEGMRIPVDIQAARQTIDILSILKTKTSGNLDQFEAQLFEEVLHNLKVAFVKKKGA